MNLETLELGSLIRGARMNKGLSRVQVEKSAEGISAQLLADVEEGKRPLDANQCATLSALLEVDLDVLLRACHAFHRKFWAHQGVEPVMEVKVGYPVPTNAEAAALRDEIARLRSDLSDGIDVLESATKADGIGCQAHALTAWLMRARASLTRADAALGIKE